MTKLVPEGYTLLSEIRRRIVDENSGAALNSLSTKRAITSLHKTGGAISRLTGGYNVVPDAGSPPEGGINSAMTRQDEMYQLADAKIRNGLLGQALSPVAFRDDSAPLRIVDYDWRDADFNSGRIYLDNGHWRADVCFKTAEVEKFLKLSKKGGKDVTIKACEALLKREFANDAGGRVSKGDFYKIAHAELDIGTKWFKAAWDAVAPAERRGAGPKPKAK